MKDLRIVLVLFIFLTGCLGDLAAIQKTVTQDATPTNAEIIAGLKEALKVGAKDAAGSLSATDGYFNSAYKILLPSEADVILTNLSKIPGGQKMVDDVILRVNRSAESAAKTAAPIFADAITNMSFSDAMGILRGGKDSATRYLDNTTRTQLVEAYRPGMNDALNTPMVAGISANQSWNVLVGSYNKVAGSIVGKIGGMEAVDTKLDEYVLNRAIDGLFSEVAIEEAAIRENPMQYTSGIIKKVFGYAQTLK